ncbi:MAG: DUF2225 domain-containing protein [Eubacteriales bacterium]|nr:DUF2225 domain-containing protein [Eubacteriales bacterium]
MAEDKLTKDESVYIFDKTMKCPVCDRTFTTKQVRTGKARFLGTDEVLRPSYTGVDVTKYDVVMCPHCGYAALNRTYGHITPKQIQAVKRDIADRYTAILKEEPVYSYDMAIRRCKMAMLTAMVIKQKVSENAYLCLKLAWIYRGAIDEMKTLKDNETKIKKYQLSQHEYLVDAYNGFAKALETEYPPICNIDEMTLNYLMTSLAVECGEYDDALKYAFAIIGSRSAASGLKEKARVLADQIKAKRNEGIK